jgi:hypothetical protein
MSTPVLCYVSGSAAYFTTQSLDEAWGDDWNDAPYEHNSGEPYEWRPTVRYAGSTEPIPNPQPEWFIVTVYWYGPFETPDYPHSNSPWSVDRINRGDLPWLRDLYGKPPRPSIWAGTTLDDFKAAIWAAGGRIWTEEWAVVPA